DALFVAYYASAELGCFKALDWPMPTNVLDLFIKFRNRTNGLTTPAGSGLIGALTYFGLDNVGAVEKEDMRALVLAGSPWSSTDRAAILDYCAGDVAALERLLPAMLPQIDLPHAIVRGRYMKAAAARAACQSTQRSWRYCARSGRIFRTSSSRQSMPAMAYMMDARLSASAGNTI